MKRRQRQTPLVRFAERPSGWMITRAAILFGVRPSTMLKGSPQDLMLDLCLMNHYLEWQEEELRKLPDDFGAGIIEAVARGSRLGR